ncbi:peroxisomal membrane protein 11B-like protein [Dinothrombium tinctorium]|uniref:Peroxisomal membrane protein 11B-like protein n=1 Tax=Dinothrombium tinctorium TaxID=1965070 RepID=A0A3S3QHU9_9ACAR|nr:peroxisomal membrane protein 11B-like protein [Dinothrombium tinctorium]RWS08977.1 peroxisomal membrane protein 11B-like protein [Dinothrombium tinctorium]RWS09425.1 peroxisomal membrane protein 11B-like protein [Dinothrombium tinctorium]
METVIRLNSQTAGREKLFRLCQYSCHFLSSLLANDGKQNEPDLRKIKELELILSSTIKLIRFGRCFEMLYSSLNTLSIADPTIKTTCTLSRISSSLYLFADHLLWLSRTGLIDGNSRKWSRLSYRFWLYSITMNLIRDFYEIRQLIGYHTRFGISSLPSCRSQRRLNDEQKMELDLNTLFSILISHRNVTVDTMKNFCDFWIPLHYLGHIKLHPTLLGFLGMVSSSASIIQIIDYTYRLSPS